MSEFAETWLKARRCFVRGPRSCTAFGSILISQGNDVVFVSRQMGHASPSITLDVYGHLFRHADHGQRMRDRLEAAVGNAMETTSGDMRGTSRVNPTAKFAVALELATGGD